MTTATSSKRKLSVGWRARQQNRSSGAGRMKKLISVRLSDRDNELLKLLAEKLQMTQAEVISRALEQYAQGK